MQKIYEQVVLTSAQYKYGVPSVPYHKGTQLLGYRCVVQATLQSMDHSSSCNCAKHIQILGFFYAQSTAKVISGRSKRYQNIKSKYQSHYLNCAKIVTRFLVQLICKTAVVQFLYCMLCCTLEFVQGKKERYCQSVDQQHPQYHIYA